MMASPGLRLERGLDRRIQIGQRSPELQDSYYTRALRHKVATFDLDNPLDLSPSGDLWFGLLVPLLVVVCVVSLVFTWRVLQSRWIRPLVSCPALNQLTLLNLVVTMCGPTYIWGMQNGLWLIPSRQVYLCFLLQWMHNFALIASAWTLVLMLIERSITVYSPENTWPKLSEQMTNLTTYILVIAMISSVIGLLIRDFSITPGLEYPVCSPWWVNEVPGFAWYWVVCLQFSILPAMFVGVSMVTLRFSLARFRKIVRDQVDDMDHYSGLYLELCTKTSDKFCRSAHWLGLVFLLTYLPLGCFVVFGPVIHHHISGTQNLTAAHPDVTHMGQPQYVMTTHNATYLAATRRRRNNSSQLNLSSGLLEGLPEDYGPDGKRLPVIQRPPRAVPTTTTGSSQDDSTSEKVDPISKSTKVDPRISAKGDPGDPGGDPGGDLDGDPVVDDEEGRKSVSHSYVIHLSRTTAEVLVWMLSYCFPAIYFPVLLATEVLFQRESYGRCRQMKRWFQRHMKRCPRGQNRYRDVETQSEDSKTPGNPGSEGDEQQTQTQQQLGQDDKDTRQSTPGAKDQGMSERPSEYESQVRVPVFPQVMTNQGGNWQHDCACVGCEQDKMEDGVRPKPRIKKSKLNVSIAGKLRPS